MSFKGSGRELMKSLFLVVLSFVMIMISMDSRVHADTSCSCPVEVRILNYGKGTGTVWVNGVKMQCPAAPASNSYAECGRASFQPYVTAFHYDAFSDPNNQIASYPIGGNCASGGGTVITNPTTPLSCTLSGISSQDYNFNFAPVGSTPAAPTGLTGYPGTATASLGLRNQRT